MGEYISIEEGRVILRRKVAQAGEPAGFVARHPDVGEKKLTEWISGKGVPSYKAFRAAGMEVCTVLRVKG